MTLHEKGLSVKSTVLNITAANKYHLCLIVAIMVVFTSFTAFSTDRSASYTVTDGGKDYVVTTQAANVNDIVNAAGITLGSNDIAEYTEENDSGKINVTRRNSVTVSYHGEKCRIVTAESTVGKVLDNLGVAVGENDTLNVKSDEKVSNGLEIKVDEITKRQSTSSSLIGYNEYLTLAKSSDTVNELIEKTSNKIKVERTFEVTYTNGVQTASRLINQKFTEQKPTAKPAAAVKSSSTGNTNKSAEKKTETAVSVYNPDNAISPLTPSKEIKLDKYGRPVNYKTVYNGRGSAYTGGGTTASGRPAAVGYVAVNPKVIPYGTRLYIRSTDGKYNYGYAIASDTGGFVNMGRVADLYFSTRSECIQFGLRNIEIYVLD